MLSEGFQILTIIETQSLFYSFDILLEVLALWLNSYVLKQYGDSYIAIKGNMVIAIIRGNKKPVFWHMWIQRFVIFIVRNLRSHRGEWILSGIVVI